MIQKIGKTPVRCVHHNYVKQILIKLAVRHDAIATTLFEEAIK